MPLQVRQPRHLGCYTASTKSLKPRGRCWSLVFLWMFDVGCWSFPPVTLTASARRWLLGILLVAAVILTYAPAWHAGFIWDDDKYVTQNELLTAPDGLKRIWFSLDSPSQYFPLVYTTFRVERALW